MTDFAVSVAAASIRCPFIYEKHNLVVKGLLSQTLSKHPSIRLTLRFCRARQRLRRRRETEENRHSSLLSC